MSRRVVNHVGFIFFENLIDTPAVTDRTDKHFKIKLGIFVAKLKSYSVGVIFVDINNIFNIYRKNSKLLLILEIIIKPMDCMDFKARAYTMQRV